MAPLALSHITEQLTYTPTAVFNLEECLTRAFCAGGGAFCLGFSAGVAGQVHYSRYLPRSVKSLMVLPTVLGLVSASSMYRYSSNSCLRQWSDAATSHRLTHRDGV